MKEDIESVINENLNNIEFNLKDMDVSNNIQNLINEANENVKYKESLIKQLDELKKIGANIEYSIDMSNSELENLLKSVKF